MSMSLGIAASSVGIILVLYVISLEESG
jgi:hypothetical protein